MKKFKIAEEVATEIKEVVQITRKEFVKLSADVAVKVLEDMDMSIAVVQTLMYATFTAKLADAMFADDSEEEKEESEDK